MTKTYLVQLRLGDLFEDIEVEANSDSPAAIISAARAKVAADAALELFRSRWTNYVL